MRYTVLYTMMCSCLAASDHVTEHLYQLQTSLTSLAQDIEQAQPEIDTQYYEQLANTLQSAEFTGISVQLEKVISEVQGKQPQQSLDTAPVLSILADQQVQNLILYGDKQGQPQQETDTTRSYQAQAALLLVNMLEYTRKSFTSIQQKGPDAPEYNPETFITYAQEKGWWRYVQERENLDTHVSQCLDKLFKELPSQPSPLLQKFIFRNLNDILLQDSPFLQEIACLTHRIRMPKLRQATHNSPISFNEIDEETMSDIQDEIEADHSIPSKEGKNILQEARASLSRYIDRFLQNNPQVTDNVARDAVLKVIQSVHDKLPSYKNIPVIKTALATIQHFSQPRNVIPMDNPITQNAVIQAILDAEWNNVTPRTTFNAYFNVASIFIRELEKLDLQLAKKLNSYYNDIIDLYDTKEAAYIDIENTPIFTVVSDTRVYNMIFYGSKDVPAKSPEELPQTNAIYLLEAMLTYVQKQNPTSLQELRDLATGEQNPLSSPQSFLDYVNQRMGWLYYVQKYPYNKAVAQCIDMIINYRPQVETPISHELFIHTIHSLDPQTEVSQTISCLQSWAFMQALEAFREHNLDEKEDLDNLSLQEVKAYSQEQLQQLRNRIMQQEHATITKNTIKVKLEDSVNQKLKAFIEENKEGLPVGIDPEQAKKTIIRTSTALIKDMPEELSLFYFDLILQFLQRLTNLSELEYFYSNPEEREQAIQDIKNKDPKRIEELYEK